MSSLKTNRNQPSNATFSSYSSERSTRFDAPIVQKPQSSWIYKSGPQNDTHSNANRQASNGANSMKQEFQQSSIGLKVSKYKKFEKKPRYKAGVHPINSTLPINVNSSNNGWLSRGNQSNNKLPSRAISNGNESSSSNRIESKPSSGFAYASKNVLPMSNNGFSSLPPKTNEVFSSSSAFSNYGRPSNGNQRFLVEPMDTREVQSTEKQRYPQVLDRKLASSSPRHSSIQPVSNKSGGASIRGQVYIRPSERPGIDFGFSSPRYSAIKSIVKKQSPFKQVNSKFESSSSKVRGRSPVRPYRSDFSLQRNGNQRFPKQFGPLPSKVRGHSPVWASHSDNYLQRNGNQHDDRFLKDSNNSVARRRKRSPVELVHNKRQKLDSHDHNSFPQKSGNYKSSAGFSSKTFNRNEHKEANSGKYSRKSRSNRSKPGSNRRKDFVLSPLRRLSHNILFNKSPRKERGFHRSSPSKQVEWKNSPQSSDQHTPEKVAYGLMEDKSKSPSTDAPIEEPSDELDFEAICARAEKKAVEIEAKRQKTKETNSGNPPTSIWPFSMF